MKVVAIMGSPRGKGSGYKVVKQIEDRMKERGSVDFEYLFLKDANLKPCIGCFNCVSKGEDKCPLKDDRAAIEKKLLEADGIILSSPVYVLNVSWLMKNFIDRFAFTNHRPGFHRQKVLTVANSGGMGLKEALSSMKHVLGGSTVVHELGVGTPPWPQTEKAVAKKEKAIGIAAEKFHKACLDTSLPSSTLYNYMGFLIQKHIGMECREYLPADYAFYKDREYYYDVKVNPVKAVAAKALVKFLLNMMKDMGPGSVSWPPDLKKE